MLSPDGAGISGTIQATGSVTDRVADPRLVVAAAAGDVAAFDELLRPRLPRLYRMALAITRSEADARDAVQDASVSAWRQVARLLSSDRFDAWLDQILVNACRTLMRRSRRVQVREIDLPSGESAHVEGRTSVGVDHAPGVSETDLIRRAFARLDPDTRVLLVLHYVEERPLAELARSMGSPVGTIKWRLSNARRALDRALEVERR